MNELLKGFRCGEQATLNDFFREIVQSKPETKVCVKSSSPESDIEVLGIAMEDGVFKILIE